MLVRTQTVTATIDGSCGKIVPRGDVEALLAAILDMGECPALSQSCVLKSMQYDKKERFREYRKLYEKIVTSKPVTEHVPKMSDSGQPSVDAGEEHE